MKDLQTELKIKETAKKLFIKKGFKETTTRDITKEAGINTALLNYYFRSKKNLFDIIMFETISTFLGGMTLIFNDEDTSLKEKIKLITNNYSNLLLNQPQLPLFILSESSKNSNDFFSKIPIQEVLKGSSFQRQCQLLEKQINPLHILINLMSLVIFPFTSVSILKNIQQINDEDFIKLIEERKSLIPLWMEAMFHL